MRRRRWVTVLLVALVAGCADTGAPTTPTGPPTSGGSEGVVQVERRAFAAGGGSGIVASRRYPGVLSAIRDRDGQGNLWIADIGNNECARTDTALLKVREPDPAAAGPARLLATYRYRFPDPPPGCAGRNAEAMFLVDDAPYLIDKADRSTLYRFPRLDPHATVTLRRWASWPARWPTCRAPTCPATAVAWPSTVTPCCTSTRPPTRPRTAGSWWPT